MKSCGRSYRARAFCFARCGAARASFGVSHAQQPWQPTKTVEFIVPAGQVGAPTRWRGAVQGTSPSTI